MLRLSLSVCIDASPKAVWKVLTDLENIQQWSEPVVSSRCVGEVKHGLGAERICRLGNGLVITECWTDWVDGQSYTYEGFDVPLVKTVLNTWTVVSEHGKTRLDTETKMVLKGGWMARVLEPLMATMIRRSGAKSLAALKYLVENGVPFKGKHSTLPKLQTRC